MRKSATWLACGIALAGFVLASLSNNAEARPGYLKEFKGAYPKLEGEADKAKCLICHYGESKKNRNDYGKALTETLGGTNIKEAEKVVEALKKAEKAKNEDGKTFGELIEAGKLPGKNP